MELYKIGEFKRGWVVGDFLPSLVRTKDFEVAVQYWKAGEGEPKHVHRMADEITIIVSGDVKMNGLVYHDGDVLLIKAGEGTDFNPITDVATCVIKIPSVIGDKYEVNSSPR